MRSYSTISSGTKRKFESTNFIKKQKLLNNNIKINNIIEIRNCNNKDKRRSFSLSNNFTNKNDFSACEDYQKLNKSTIDENLRKYKSNLRENIYFSNNKKKNNNKISEYLTKNSLNSKIFKKFLFKKSLLYKTRCLNHNSTWLLELSKSKKGNRFSELIYNANLIEPFPFYKSAINLFYEKKYKDAYILLSSTSTYSSCSFNEHNILNDNFFEKKSYNLQFMLNLLHSNNKNNLYEKNNMKKDTETNILMKNENDFTYKVSDNNDKFLFNTLLEEKNQKIINNDIVRKNSTYKCFKNKICNNNGNKKEKKKNKYIKEFNYANNKDKELIKKDSSNMNCYCNMYLKKKNYNKKGLIFNTIKEKNRNHSKNNINYNFEEFNEKYEVENYLEKYDDGYSEKKNKNISISDNDCMLKLRGEHNKKVDNCNNNMDNRKKRMNIVHNEKNIYKKEIRVNIKESIKLFIFIKILCLYLYSNSLYEENIKKDRTYQFSSTKSHDKKNLNYTNEHFNIKNFERKEILIYIVKYLNKIKKKIIFDTYLYLLLSVVYYDLKKFNKSLIYVKKSIKKDYFNFASWIFFNNLASIEISMCDNSNITAEHSNKNKIKFIENYKNKRMKKKKLLLKKNTFVRNSKKLKKLYLHLFENDYFFNIKKNYVDIMKNYNAYIYINPIKNLKESFFFKNNYFVSKIFNKNIIKRKKNRTNHNFFNKYRKYRKKYNFKNNLMTLFGYAHFCSLNNVLYKDAINVYEYLNRILQNNLYVSSQLAKLYYFCGNYNRSIKYFNQIKKINRKNQILKKEMFHNYCIFYYLKNINKEVHTKKKKDQDISENFKKCNVNHIMVINAKDYKYIKNIILPQYFSKKFIYTEILVNIFFFQKKIPDLRILIYKFQKKKKNYDERFFYMLGKYFSLSGSHNKSIYYFKKSIKIDKFHLYSYMNLAQEYLLFNSINSCIYILIKVIILYFNNSNAWFSIAKCLQYIKNYSFSIFSYQNAIYFQQNIVSYYFLANIYLKKGEVKNYIKTLKKGWKFKRSIIFSSKLFLVYLKILKEKKEFSINFSEKKNIFYLRNYMKQKYYKKDNNCFIWCVKYLRSYFKKIYNKNKIYCSKVNLKNLKACNNFNNYIINGFILFGCANKKELTHLNKPFFESLNSLYDKNTNYLYFIYLLRNSNNILFKAIFYLANYFFFNEYFYNSLKLFKILWDAGGIYSEESFKLFRFTKNILQEKY
ncbi:conserved Plasmodium protein, unknown function [Plasmodium gallinaceum]|uniref:Tetratricopeptide repeat protein n=1 Tax=Plasmodium gallinaceum TaxID=5849 RepID=A0A1J1GSU7_PLAGA|nr:conserved Plasmodium protein, unknown function [Plasmodium gallinaceum]CRG95553.1 conserved Plasmodium protein, unknown function [Plasmodium gallinaceum]